MRTSSALLSLLASSLLAATACGSDSSSAFKPGDRDDTFRTTARGETCQEQDECKFGLICTPENICDYRQGEVAQGEACAVTIECGQGLSCDPLSERCIPEGERAADEVCDTTADCAAGLSCRPRGFSAVCVMAGSADVGDACEQSADCLAGLGCAMAPGASEASCVSGPAGQLPAVFAGADCSASDEESGPLRFYFEPRSDSRREFFRLPFPHDARLKDGRPVLDGFPTPGTGVVGIDIVQTYVDAIEKGQDRWGTNPAILLRSSGALDFDTITANDDPATEADDRTIFLVDISPQSETYNERWPLFWEARGGGGSKRPYICQNWLAARPFWGRPLRPDTTYALVVKSDVRGADGAVIEQDRDFAVSLQNVKPGNIEDARVWATHAPLRTWMVEESLAPADLLVASVFTTGDPLATASTLRDAVRAAAAPQASELTLCESNTTTSPCEDGLEGEARVRGCFEASSDFHELQGRLALPIFQRGAAPYLTEGGALDKSPAVQRIEPVCMAMTVPKKRAMPEAGWPVLIYAHGTGGSYRNGVVQAAPRVSDFGGAHGMVVVSWDQVQHFNRRGDSTLDPEPLVFNYANPEAARGNFTQGAADVHALVRFVEDFSLDAAASPTGEAIKLDPSQVYFWGHSQGGTTGPLALPFEPGIRGAILSGAGAGLALGLLDKTSPVNSPEALKLALQDPNVSTNHPVINLIQGYFDPVDPINFAPYLGTLQRPGVTQGMNVFHVFGLLDTYSPPSGMKALARALRATYLGPILDDLGGGVTLKASGSVSANRRVGEESFTVVGRQYDPMGAYDGHFVLSRDARAQRDMLEFLQTALEDTHPSLSHD